MEGLEGHGEADCAEQAGEGECDTLGVRTDNEGA